MHVYNNNNNNNSKKCTQNKYTTEKLVENLGDEVCIKKGPSTQQQQTTDRACHLARIGQQMLMERSICVVTWSSVHVDMYITSG